ncbi:MAG: LLM class flavin-dependent oxidoreductase [bacterium]
MTTLDRRVDKSSAALLASDNRLRLAVFSPNMAGGNNLTLAPEAPQATWEESKRLALAAEAAGFEALISVARWRGMSPRAQAHRCFDGFTWAAAVAAITTRIDVLATVHVPLTHPLLVAKQSATVDHVSGGRFGLNVVAGWNDDELRMFGIDPAGRDNRYESAEEWMTLLERLWQEEQPFDAGGPLFPGSGMLSEPKPLQHPAPMVMNAGVSPAGRAFAARHADLAFALLPDLASAGRVVADIKAQADSTYGRHLHVMVAAHVVCAETEADARATYRRMTGELADRAAAVNALRLLVPDGAGVELDRAAAEASAVAGFFAMPIVGTPHQVVEQLAELADSGVDAVAMSWLDYEAGIAQYHRTLRPLLADAGLRRH